MRDRRARVHAFKGALADSRRGFACARPFSEEGAVKRPLGGPSSGKATAQQAEPAAVAGREGTPATGRVPCPPKRAPSEELPRKSLPHAAAASAMSKPTTVKGSPAKPFGLNPNAQAIPTQATLGKNFLGLGPNLTALGLATVFFGVYYGTAWYTRKWVHEQTDGNPVRPHSFSEVKVVDNSVHAPRTDHTKG